MSHTVTDRRAVEIKLVHIAKAHFGWSDDEYRDILYAVTGCRSAKDLDFTKRNLFLDHCRKLGFVAKPRASGKTRPTPAPAVLAQVKKVRAILISLGNKPNEYGDAILCKLRGVEDAATRYEWATGDELRQLIAALSQQQKRAVKPA